MYRSVFAVLVAITLFAPKIPLSAQAPFSDADLVGDYAITLSVGEGAYGNVDSYTGILTADGQGNLSGVRTYSYGLGLVEDSISGTYTVNPDGTGTAHIVATPPVHENLTGQETWKFSLSSRGLVFVNGFLDTTRNTHWTLNGTFVRREQDIDLAPVLDELSRLSQELANMRAEVLTRLDDLEARQSELDTKQCEAIRLLNTPEGLRFSNCCAELLDFPNGKDAATCGSSQPAPFPSDLPARPRTDIPPRSSR